MKYRTIYADPPWMEHGSGKSPRGADAHYSLMKTREIMALPVQELADPEGCHLYLWTTNNFLPDALRVVRAWGFEYVTIITWMKDRKGLGQYYRGLTEHCIFARTKKKLPYKLEDGKRCQGVTGFLEPKGPHSRKPETMREMIERVSYGPRIELFAREPHAGWDVWGKEVDGVALSSDGGGGTTTGGIIPRLFFYASNACNALRNAFCALDNASKCVRFSKLCRKPPRLLVISRAGKTEFRKPYQKRAHIIEWFRGVHV